MRGALGFLVLLGVTVFSSSAHADLGGFVIADFHAALTVERNADLLVEESITIDFSEERHGIYRTIPVRYTDPMGYGYSLRLRVLDVTDGEGRDHKFQVQDQGRYVNIRIGDPDRTVTGRVRYVLRYRVREALGHFAKHDEIYWNVTGNEWEAPILRASASVRLPAALPADSLVIETFVGRFGSREKSASVTVTEPGIVSIASNRPLEQLEGLTIAVAWPVGHVEFPGAPARLARFFADNWVLLAPLVVLAALWRRYRRVGVDPRAPASVMVRYEPPPGVTPGEIGTLVDERVDLRDIAATLVDLAVRGYLTIRVEKREILLGLTHQEETVFARTKKDAADLRPHEVILLAALFESGGEVDTSDLRQKFYVHLPSIRTALYDGLVKQGHFSSHPGSVRSRYRALSLLVGIVVFGIGLLWVIIRGGILPNGLAVPAAAAITSVVLCFAFAPAMPRRTASGVRLRSWARGFQEFVTRVEKEKLEQDEARNVFETLLPYAMALGVAERWAKRFEGLYDNPPAWFIGGSPGSAFSTSAFHHTLASAVGRAGSSMTSSPRGSGSSGTGGGGSSGGGGGGGGGGAW
jgi:uncharacterized membrane protein YgcG